MPSPTVAQRISTLKQLIDSYERKKFKKDIASLKRQFAFELTYSLIVPAIAAILTALFANLAAMLAPIGVGVANIADKFALSKTILSSYFKDKCAVEARPDAWRARIRLAEIQQDPTKQNEMLNAVEQSILACYPST